MCVSLTSTYSTYNVCVCVCVCVCVYKLKYTCNHVSVGEEAAPDVKYKAQERGFDAHDVL
jgi:hypothetical protein